MAKITQSSPNCAELIKHFESLFLKSYLCPAKVPTIGYGTTIYPNGEKVMLNQTCTMEQAGEYLQHDLLYFEKTVDAYTRDDVSQQQFDALVSFAYTAGANNLKTSTLLKIINVNPTAYPKIEAQFLKWDKTDCKTLKSLERRRNAEFYHYKTGMLKFNF